MLSSPRGQGTLATMVRFWLQFGDREIALPDGELLVGRGEGCHVRLTAPSVSRRHLRIVTVGDSVVVFDLDSRNGTWVNDERLTRPVKLDGGDVVQVGTQTFAIREAPTAGDAFEEEPDTCDLEVEKRFQSRPTEPPAGRQTPFRPTVELDRSAMLDERAAIEPGAVSVGSQLCAVCGNSIELGLSRCPFCSAEPYSTPKYRTCLGCTALLSEADESCSKCGLARPVTGSGRGVDRRRESRMTTALAGLYVSSSLTFEAEISNLSRGGLFIAAELLDPVGTPADIILSTPDDHRARFSGEVAHVVDGPRHPSGLQPGMGIRFLDVSPASRAWLDAFLSRVGGGGAGE